MAGEPSNPPEAIARARLAARAQQHDVAAPSDTPVSAAAAAAATAPVDVSLQQQMQQQQAELAALQAHNARLTAEVGELEGTRSELRGVISQMTAIYDVDQEEKAQLQARLDAQLAATIALSGEPARPTPGTFPNPNEPSALPAPPIPGELVSHGRFNSAYAQDAGGAAPVASATHAVQHSRLLKPAAIDIFVTNGATHISDWLLVTAHKLKVANVPQRDWAQTASCSLDQQASLFWIQTTQGVSASTLTWEFFSESMVKAYGSKDRERLARVKLDRIKQEKDVPDFARRFHTLVASVKKLPPSAGELIHRFKAGLKPRVYQKMLLKSRDEDWTSLEEIIRDAIAAETDLSAAEAMSGMLSEHVGRISAATAPAVGSKRKALHATPSGPRSNPGDAKRSGGQQALTPETAPILPPDGISDADKSRLYAPFGVVWREHNRRKAKAEERAGKWCQACDDGHFTHQCPRKQAMLGGGAAPLGNRINTARYKLSEFSWPTAAAHGRKK